MRNAAIGLAVAFTIIVGLAAMWVWQHEGQGRKPKTESLDFTPAAFEPTTPEDDLKELRTRAENGDANAQYEFGHRYHLGKGVTQDYTEAAQWCRKAAEQGLANAQYTLSGLYLHGRGVPKDYTEAVKWCRKGAEQGHAKAQSFIGDYYYDGRGVPKDTAEAAKWYHKAAEQGNINAQFHLGVYYSRDRAGTISRRNSKGIYLGTVQPDYEEATKWYRKAAEQGFDLAQYHLGLCYFFGKGVTQDYSQAAMWFRKAADQGHAHAQNKLGLCYAAGHGIPQNDIEAYKWLSLAAAQGSEVFAQERDLATRRMARTELAEAQNRAATFVARKKSLALPDGPRARAQPLIADSALKASGTAFFISDDGYLLSNYHVVEGASRVAVKTGNDLLPARVVKTDPFNDIALLKVSGSFRPLPLATSQERKLGDSVFTIGYPNIRLQGIEPKLTKGEISSLSGALDDPREFQISVPVQPGNSGGPLVNADGNVIGIVTARLSGSVAFEATGALPQNVNYAIKISYALLVLDSVPELSRKLKTSNPARKRKFEDVVQQTRAATALVLIY